MEDTQTDRTRFVVGLGNPGRSYRRTRHNVGFKVAEELIRRWDADRGRKAFGGRLYEANAVRPVGRRRVMVLLPQTYMNRSGRAVGEMAGFYKARPADILVVMDDMALPLGRLRVRPGGSAGGHKGLGDVLAAVGANDVPRLRIGIGLPQDATDAVDYVLARFRKDELETIERAIRLAADAVEDWVFMDIEFAMEKYNRRNESARTTND